MADLTDVEAALVSIVNTALYPNGTPTPGVPIAPSITSDSVRIFAGWPNAGALDTDVAAKIVNVSVFPKPGATKNTTRFPKEWQDSIAPVTTLTATVAANVVTLGGTPSGTQYVAVILGIRKVYGYALTSNDTLATAAAALAALIAADYSVSVVGPAITITTSADIVARVGASGTSWMELRRQERGFMVAVWASSPDQRTRVAKVVDVAFAQVERMTLADNSSARLIYESDLETDEGQRVTIYRRTFFFTVEYATSITASDFEIVSFGARVRGGISPPDAPVQSVQE